MWQRIQTLLLALAILFNGSIYFLNLAKVSMLGMEINFNMYGLVTPEYMGNPQVIYWLSILASLSITMSLVAIFSFKKRQQQIKIARFNLLMQLGFIAGIFYAVEYGAGHFNGLADGLVPEYQLGAYLSLIPLIFIFLAIKNIRKDEALVRAADRIR